MSRKYILFTAHMHTQYGIRMSLVHIQIILCAYAHMFDTRCDFVGSYPEPQGWIVMRRFSSSKADMFWWNCDDMFLRKQGDLLFEIPVVVRKPLTTLQLWSWRWPGSYHRFWVPEKVAGCRWLGQVVVYSDGSFVNPFLEEVGDQASPILFDFESIIKMLQWFPIWWLRRLMLWIAVDNKRSPECLSMHFSIHTKKLNREKKLEIHKKMVDFVHQS